MIFDQHKTKLHLISIYFTKNLCMKKVQTREIASTAVLASKDGVVRVNKTDEWPLQYTAVI